jgi:hypothetical protein
MSHILARLSGVRIADVRRQLEKDASGHAEQGMYLEHLWKNSEEPDEVLFLFRVDDLNRCKQLMNRIHAEARQTDPNAVLPQVVFLAEA